MAIQAQLADGRTLEFPDGTDPSVIQSTVKRIIAEGVQPQSGALVSGFKSYLPQLQETYGGIKALLGVGAERALGRGTVSEALMRSGAESMAEAEKRMAPLATAERSSFTNALDKGIGSVLTEWLPYQAGSGAANLLESLGVMFAGGLAGTAVAPGAGTIGGAATGLVAKEMAKRGIKEATEKILKESGEEAAKSFLEREARKATVDVAKRVGGTAALGAQAGFYGTGQTAQRAFEEAERRGEAMSDIELARVLPAAAVSTAAEFISDKIGLGAFKGLDKAGQNYVANIARNILVTGTKETPTEIVQSMAERFGAKLSLTDAAALKEYIDATAASYGMSVVPGTAGGVRGTMAAREQAKAEAERRAREPEAPAAPEVVTLPPTAKERIEEATGVTATPAGVTPMTAEEAEAAGAAEQRATAERARIARLQQMAEADMAAQEERARREGIQPVVPPRAPTPERTVAPLAEREMPQATPMDELRAKQAEVDRRRLEAGLPTGESSMFPGFQPRPPLEGEAPAPAPAPLVDERPMTERAAKNRLLVLKNLYKNAGRDPESIAIVPHPTVPDRFAIQSLDRPAQLTRGLPETAVQREPSPKVLDPVEAYVNVQRRTNTDAARRFVQDWDAGRITRADVEQTLEQEAKAGRPAPLSFTKEGEPELMEPEKGYRVRPEFPAYLDFKGQLRDLLNRGEKFFVDAFTQDGKRTFYASPFATLNREERVELVLSDKENKAANEAQDKLDAAATTDERIAAENQLRLVLNPAAKRAVAEIDKFAPPTPPPVTPPTVTEEEPPTEEPPGGEPPPPTVEPPKTVAELRQRLPVSSENAKIRAANNNGSFEDLANILAASANPVTARVGELAKKISKEVRLLKPKQLNKAGTYAGVYNRKSDTVQMDPRYAGDEWTNTHEVVHALVARSQVAPTPRQRPIVRQLDDLYDFVRKETKRRGINPKTIYGLENPREFASEAMSNPEFQFYLMSIPYKGKRSAWTEFTRLVANLLGIKDTNALTEAINLVDRIAQTKRAPYSSTMFSEVDFVVEPGQPPVLDTSDIKPMKGRHPQMTAAARALRDGKISRSEYDQYVNFYKPIAMIDMGRLDAPATTDNMFQTVDSNKQDKINAPIADGEKVGLRMDLPARERGIAKGINGAVVSIHEGASGKATQGKVKSFQSTAYLKDVTFEPRSQKKGLATAAGEAKQPLQTVEGTFFNMSPDEVFKRVKELNGKDGWVQVGFDPTRHGYFYDRNTKQPVKSASEMYQVGNFLLAKDVTYAPVEQFDYMQVPEQEGEAPTLPAGAKPMDVVGFMGIKPQKQEESTFDRTKRLINEFNEDPELTKSSIAKSLTTLKDKFENNVFSTDSAFNNKVRSELIKDIDQNKDVIGTLIEMSQSQTVHSDALAGVFIQMGGLRYDNDAKKWVGFEEQNNFINLSRKIDDIAAKYNLTKEEAMRVAHANFIARRLRSLQDRNAEIETEIANLPKGDDKIAKLRESIVKIHLNDDQIQAGLDLSNTMPELNEVFDTWNGIRTNTVKLLVQSGMWSDETANAMLDVIDYVPFYREEQLEAGEGPKEFVRGLQVKAKEHRLKGSDNPVNDVFDNMVRWTQYAINRSIRNHKSLQLIDQAVNIDVIDGKMAEQVKESGDNVVRVWRDGKQEFYKFADPLFADAFLPIQNVSIPSLKIFSWFANLLRQSVVLYPLFSVAQVPQDSFAAMFSSGLQPKFAFRIPFLAVKEFVQTIAKTSATHNALKKYGAVGVRDFTSTVIRDDAEIVAGLKKEEGWVKNAIAKLGHISMAADNAVRQAVYDAAMQQGLSKAEALEKAFEIINFRRRPKSTLLNIAGQTIPFFYAYLAAQRVAYNTVTGVGISPQERKAGLKTLAYTSSAVMALSFLYAMLNEDDEEYQNTPTALRDRTLTVPGTGGFRIPLRPDFFLFPKIVGEHLYHLITENGFSDSAKVRTSMKDAALGAILSPTPFPQVVKPAFEVYINRNFFTGRPLIGVFEQNKEAERLFNDSTSELAKVLGSSGLISPIALDHLIRGMFGSFGGLVLWGSNYMIQNDPNVERPDLTWRDVAAALPGTSGLLSKPSENALKNDFYLLRDEVEKAKNTFDDYKKYSPQGLEEYVNNEKVMARLAMAKQVEKISNELSKIRRSIKQINQMPSSMISSDEKEQAIKELRQAEKDMLKAAGVPEMRKAAQL